MIVPYWTVHLLAELRTTTLRLEYETFIIQSYNFWVFKNALDFCLREGLFQGFFYFKDMMCNFKMFPEFFFFVANDFIVMSIFTTFCSFFLLGILLNTYRELDC